MHRGKRRSVLETGFTLIEVIISTGIAAIIMTGLSFAFSHSFLFVHRTKDVAEVTQEARGKMEQVINIPFDELIIADLPEGVTLEVVKPEGSEDLTSAELIKVTVISEKPSLRGAKIEKRLVQYICKP